MRIREAENILEIYTLEEILDQNGLTDADVLVFLVNEEFVELPEPQPLDFYD